MNIHTHMLCWCGVVAFSWLFRWVCMLCLCCTECEWNFSRAVGVVLDKVTYTIQVWMCAWICRRRSGVVSECCVVLPQSNCNYIILYYCCFAFLFWGFWFCVGFIVFECVCLCIRCVLYMIEVPVIVAGALQYAAGSRTASTWTAFALLPLICGM